MTTILRFIWVTIKIVLFLVLLPVILILVIIRYAIFKHGFKKGLREAGLNHIEITSLLPKLREFHLHDLFAGMRR